MIKLSRDINGNKTVKFFPNNGSRGFSVQTLGTMPKAHKMNKYSFDWVVAMAELRNYVLQYGTDRQKDLMS